MRVNSPARATYRLTFGLVTMIALNATLSARPVGAVEVTEIQSDYGPVAWLVEDHRLPIIDFQIAFRRGWWSEPTEEEGIATLTANLMLAGAGKRDETAFIDALDEISASLDAYAGANSIGIDLRTLAEHQEQAFALLRDAIHTPRFDKAPLERIRQSLISARRQNRVQPRQRATHLLYETIYPNHPAGRNRLGTETSLAKLSRDHVKAFHKKVIARENVVVVAVGAITPEALAKQMNALFETMAATYQIDEVDAPQCKAPKEKRVVEHLDVPQSEIRFALKAPPADSPDFFAAHLLNHILGGSTFGSRLFLAVREERGLAYATGSALRKTKNTACFIGHAGVATADTSEALGLIGDVLETLGREGPNAQDLDLAKRYVKSAFHVSLDSNADIAHRLTALRLNEREKDYIVKRDDLLDAVTLDDIRRVAKTYLQTDPVFSIVGDPKGFQAQP